MFPSERAYVWVFKTKKNIIVRTMHLQCHIVVKDFSF